MGVSALKYDYNLDPPDDYDDNYYEDLELQIEKLSKENKELIEENIWLRFTLEKYNLLDKADEMFEKFLILYENQHNM